MDGTYLGEDIRGRPSTLSCLSIWGGAGGVVTSSRRLDEESRSSSLWKDEEANTEGCGDSSTSAVLQS